MKPDSAALATLVLALSLAVPARSASVPVTVVVDGEASGPLSGTLRVTAVGESGRPAELLHQRKVTVPYAGLLTLPDDRPFEVSVDIPGHWAPTARPVAGAAGSGLEIRLLPTGIVSGVATVAGGEAIPTHLALTVQPASARGQPPSATGKIPRSTFGCELEDRRWSCEVPAGLIDLRLELEGFTPNYVWAKHLAPHDTLDLGSIAFNRGASLTGWVALADSDSDPEGVRIELRPQQAGIQPDPLERVRGEVLAVAGSSDERGFFQIRDLLPGIYTLNASKPGHATARIPALEVAERRELFLDRPVVLERPVELEAYIDPPSDFVGQPWFLALTRREGASNAFATVAKEPASAEGHWRHDGLEPGSYGLEVRDSGGSSWLSRNLDVTPQMSPLFLEIEHVPIRGTVTLGDEPLETTIVFGTTTRRPSVKVWSDDEGRFAGRLPHEGLWPVELAHGDRQRTQAVDPVEVRRRSGKSYAEVEIALPDTRISGKVVESAAPVPGATVLILRQRDGKIRREALERAAEDGSFELHGLLPGRLQVQAYTRFATSDVVTVNLREDSPDPDLSLEIQRRVELSGRVVSAAGGVAGAVLNAMPFKAGVAALSVSSVTAADGGFTLKLPEGTDVVDLMLVASGLDLQLERRILGQPPHASLTIAAGTHHATLVAVVAGFDQILQHGGAAVPLPWVLNQLERLGRVEYLPPPRGGIALRGLAPGGYALCSLSEPPPARCATGELLPESELVLTLGPKPDGPVPAPEDTAL